MSDSEKLIEIGERAKRLRQEIVPASREAEDDEVTARFDVPEMPSRGGRPASLHDVTIGAVTEQARSFKNEYLRLVWLALAVATAVYLLKSGIVRIGPPG